MNEEFNIVGLKRQQEAEEKKKEVSIRQTMLQKMNEFAEMHPIFEHLFYCTATDESYFSGNRSPDTNRTWYGLARYFDKEDKESLFYRLEANCDCLCGCDTRRVWLSVFEFESPSEALTIGEFIKSKDNYALSSYPEGRMAEVRKMHRKANRFNLQVNFGEGYGKYSEACGFEIPHEKGSNLLTKLTVLKPHLKVN